MNSERFEAILQRAPNLRLKKSETSSSSSSSSPSSPSSSGGSSANPFAELLRRCETKEYQFGEEILKRDETLQGFFVVAHGAVLALGRTEEIRPEVFKGPTSSPSPSSSPSSSKHNAEGESEAENGNENEREGSDSSFSHGGPAEESETLVHVFHEGDTIGVQGALKSDAKSPVRLIANTTENATPHHQSGATLVFVPRKEYMEVFAHTFHTVHDAQFAIAYRGRVSQQPYMPIPVAEFRGIRYAQAGRYEVPVLTQPVESSPEYPTYALEFGPSCPQVQAGAGERLLPQPERHVPALLTFKGYGEVDTGAPVSDEDCHFLNVFAPAEANDNQKEKKKQQLQQLPVMVWIHGGGFLTGSGADGFYDGRELSSKGPCVVFTINYRLGPLGFLNPPEAESDVPTNLGLHDQLCALRWVKRHCHMFGGDPTNITVFGESAGGMSIGCLLGMKQRRDEQLFHKAIPQSGAAHAVFNKSQAKETASRFANELANIAKSKGLPGELASKDLPLKVANLKKFELQDLLAGVTGLFSSFAKVKGGANYLQGILMPFQPACLEDGPLFRDVLFEGVPPLVAVARGIASDVKVMTGTLYSEYTLFMVDGAWKKPFNESRGFMSGYRSKLVSRVARYIAGDSRYRHHYIDMGSRATDDQRNSALQQSVSDFSTQAAQSLVDHYIEEVGVSPTSKSAKLSKKQASGIWEKVHSAWLFGLPAVHLLTAQGARNGGEVYMYRVASKARVGTLGSTHALDLPLMFGTWRVPLIQQVFTGTGPAVEQTSEEMMKAWLDFARNGNPGWERYTPVERKAMVFGADETTGKGGVTDSPEPSNKCIHAWQGICEHSSLSLGYITDQLLAPTLSKI